MSARLGAPKPIRPAGSQDVDMQDPDVQAQAGDDPMHLDADADADGDADADADVDREADAGPSSPSRGGDAAADAPLQPEYDDPNLLASYPIYLSTSLPPTSSLQLLQYPTYPRRQPLPVPSNSLSRGMTQAIRWRPKAGWVQVELPLDLRAAVYHEEKGQEMGQGVRQLGGEIGQGKGVAKKEDSDDEDMSGRRRSKKGKGKSKSQDALNGVNGEGVPAQKLRKIRLESDVMPHMTKYCVGVMRDQALHLTHLDRVVQLRPSLHHLDGMDALEAEDKRNAAKALSGEGDESDAGGAGAGDEKKPPAAYNVSVKVAGGGPGGPGGMGGGAGDSRDQLMASKRRAEGEEWVELQWRDMHGVHKSTVQSTLSSQLFAGSKTPLRCKTKPRDYLP